jgi:hypothetical protein
MEKLPFFIHGQPITDQTAEDNVEGEHRLRCLSSKMMIRYAC